METQAHRLLCSFLSPWNEGLANKLSPLAACPPRPPSSLLFLSLDQERGFWECFPHATALMSSCWYVHLYLAFPDPMRLLWFSQPNHLDSVREWKAGNKLGKADSLRGNPRSPKSCGLQEGEACTLASLLTFIGRTNFFLLAGRWPSQMACRPCQFPHSYIQGMSCWVQHLLGIFRETQDRRTCEDLSYKQWKHWGGTEKENSFKREVGKKMFQGKHVEMPTAAFGAFLQQHCRLRPVLPTPCSLFVSHLHVPFYF